MSGHIDFGFDLSDPEDRPARELDETAPQRIVILGDFSGRGGADAGTAPPLVGSETQPTKPRCAPSPRARRLAAWAKASATSCPPNAAARPPRS